MSQGLRMVASAVVGAALTAAFFLTFQGGADPGAPAPAAPAALSARTPSSPPPAPPPADLPALRGDGEIRGRVATKEGEGVEGVVVVATPRPERWSRGRSDGGPPVLDLDEEVRKAVAAAHRRVTGTRSATTDAEGRYLLEGLGDAAYYLVGYAKAWSIRAARGSRDSDAKPGDVVDFVAKAIVRVRITVEGLDPAGGRVTVRTAADSEPLKRAGGRHWSPDSPVLTLEPGTRLLQAVQGEDRERISEPVEVALVAGAPEQAVVLVLRERPGLRGAIVVRDLLDVRRADVYALRFEGEEPPPVDPLRGNRGAILGRCDTRDMTYSILDLAPGRYYVWVTLDGRSPMGSAVVEVRDRLVERDIEVGIDDPERYVVARVIGPDGEPLEARDTRFSSSFRSARIVGGYRVEALHRTDGSWLIAPDSAIARMLGEDLPDGAWWVQVTHRSLGSRELVCDPGKQRELTFRFAEPATVTVVFTGLAEAGLAGRAELHLRTHLESSGISLGGNPVRSAGNVYTLDKVQPGEWILVLVADMIQVDRKPIRVGEGKNTVRWALPPLHTVELEPADGESSIRFGLTCLDPAGNWTHQFAGAANGEAAVLRYVPPGHYVLTGTYGGEDRRILIDVPAQTRVRLE